MTKALIAALVVLLGGCSSGEERRHRALMDEIEAQVELPPKAWRLDEYARYYADVGDGTVRGVYILPAEGAGTGDICELLEADGSSRAVPCPDMRPDWHIPADERRWLKDHQALPSMNDGGCAQVNVVFDKAKSSVISETCNAEL